MATITKKNLVGRIAETTNTKRSTVKMIVQCFLDEIVAELAKNNRLEFRDFGVFEVREQAPRTAQNPKTLSQLNQFHFWQPKSCWLRNYLSAKMEFHTARIG